MPPGFQVPTFSRIGTPTRGASGSSGRDTFWSTLRSRKWMKPLGQPVSFLSMRFQLKSPPQLSCDTMMTVGEITFST